MKYVVLIYSNPASWVHPMFLNQREPLSDDERAAQLNQFETLMKEISQSGELLGACALADPVTTKTIRPQDGVLTATDGPFADAKEHLAGFFIIECESLERAVEIGSRFPDARNSGVEVRPVVEPSDMVQ